jgi:hypothetical protein
VGQTVNLHPHIETSETVRRLPFVARVMFPWDLRFTVEDAHGCFRINPLAIVARAEEMFPEQTREHVLWRLWQYATTGPLLEVWEAHGRVYGHWTAWYAPVGQRGEKVLRVNSFRPLGRATPVPPSLEAAGGDPNKMNWDGREFPSNAPGKLSEAFEKLAGRIGGRWNSSGKTLPGSFPEASGKLPDPHAHAHAHASEPSGDTELLEKGNPAGPVSGESEFEPRSFQDPYRILPKMAGIVQKRRKVPYVIADVHGPTVASLIRAGQSEERIMAVWDHYVQSRKDPARIDVGWFVKDYNRHHADYSRSKP